MYRSQRRKSGRATPYDVASSSASNRKSGQFICPVTDYNESLSAVKKTDTSTSLLRTSLTDLQNLNHSAEKSKPKPSGGKEDEDLFDSEYDRLLGDADATTKMESKSPGERHASDQENDVRKQPVNDDCHFDSEYDRMINNSNLDQLSKVFDKQSSQMSNAATQETKEDEVDKELNRLNARTEDDADEELFDSDAVNDEESDDEQSNDMKSEPSRHDENSPEEDLDRLAKEEEDDDQFGVELDNTLIKSDDPSENEFFTQAVMHFNPEDGDFRTAGGDPITLKMTEEQQRARARSLGIVCDYDPRSQAFK